MSASPFRRFWHRVLMWSGPLALLWLALYSVCGWASERLWFESLGYGAHFGRLFWWRAGSFAIGALFFALWLGANAQVAWRNAAAHTVPLSFFQSDAAPRLIPLEDKFQLDRYRRRVTIGTVLMVSLGAGLGFSARYGLLMRAFFAAPTAQRDSASHFDLAFFLFTLPFYHWLWRVLLGAIVTALLLVGAIYLYEETLAAPAESASSSSENRATRVSSRAARHLAILWSMLLLWKGLDCALGVPESFVSSGNVAARVFDPVDIRAGWTSAALFALSAPLVALLSGLSIARAPRIRVFGAGALWMILASGIPFLLPLVMGRNAADPDWKNALSRHIRSTRRAWSLDATERRSLALAPGATFRPAFSESAVSSAGLTSPLALWPAASAREALNARLAAQNSTFRVGKVSLERVGASLRYVGLAVPPLAAGESEWRLQHQRIARGIWVQIEAARLAPGGAPIFQPDLRLSALVGAPRASADAPPSRDSLEPLASPESGAAADEDEWIFTAPATRAASDQMGSPASPPGESGEDAARGVSLASLSVRWLLAMRWLEPQLLRAAWATDRITWHRGAAQRCRALAPFLDWRDDEARAVILSDGPDSTKNEGPRLVYLVPGLIWSDDYPDSATPAPVGTAPPGVNYGRHIALGVVDARSGAVTLTALDEDEPFMALYSRAFPALFAPPSSLPTSIRAQLRPSPALLSAQTLIWARYHHENTDREALAWAAQADNYRPLLSQDFGPAMLPIAGQGAGDWLCVSYARPQGQVGGGAVSALVSILGADERDFASRGAKVRFVEWKARAPIDLPDLLGQPTLGLVDNRPVPPPPTLLGLAPRIDNRNNATGLFASRGETRFLIPKTVGVQRGVKLQAELQISGAAGKASPGAPLSPGASKAPRATGDLAMEFQFQNARAAWRDLQTARRKGDWNAVARAEKRLDAELGEPAIAALGTGASGTR